MSENETVHKIAPGPLDAGIASKDIKLCNLVAEIRESLMSMKQNYLRIGWALKYIKGKKMYVEEGFQNIYDFAGHYFGLSQSAVSRFINICEEFTVGDRPELMERYASYNLSQLTELLPMGEELRDQATPEMTVTQLRNLKKAGAEKEQEEGEKNSRDPDRPDTNESNAESPCNYILPYVEKGWQIDLPRFRNDDERVAWLYNIESWGFWYVDPNIKTEYFKYDFEDGSRLIASKYKNILSSYDGQIDNGKIHYHMVFSDSFLEKHQKDYLEGYQNYCLYCATPMEHIISFLEEIQNKEAEDMTEEEEYFSNDYIMKEFNPDHTEDVESYIGKSYANFYEKNGFIAPYYDVKHRLEISECAHTLATGSGSTTSIGSTIFFDAEKEAAAVVNNEELDKESACRMIDKIVRVAKPEEKEKVERLLGITYPSVEEH